MATRTAWVLNLDADLELAAGANYAPTRIVLQAMRPHVERLARSLLGPEDVLCNGPDTDGVDARGLVGRAFCPTPRALALLERAGAVPAEHPSLEVLRRVNSRAFCSALGATLPDAGFFDRFEAALARLHGASPVRVKRNHGMAGRGQRVMPPIDLPFLRGSFPGGVQIEPNVDIEAEYAIHGMLARDGSVRVGPLMQQTCDAHGQWLATTPADEPALAARMGEEALLVARGLHAAGYFGPFGIDAFTYDGKLQPRSEINARYSMGFPRALVTAA